MRNLKPSNCCADGSRPPEDPFAEYMLGAGLSPLQLDPVRDRERPAARGLSLNGQQAKTGLNEESSWGCAEACAARSG